MFMCARLHVYMTHVHKCGGQKTVPFSVALYPDFCDKVSH